MAKFQAEHMLHTCPICGTITSQPYCERHRKHHQPDGQPKRNTSRQRAFRNAVLKRDNHRCRDCGSTTDLRACHITPLAAYLNPDQAYNTNNGITRCAACDQKTDPYARPPRTGSPTSLTRPGTTTAGPTPPQPPSRAQHTQTKGGGGITSRRIEPRLWLSGGKKFFVGEICETERLLTAFVSEDGRNA